MEIVGLFDKKCVKFAAIGNLLIQTDFLCFSDSFA